jgi:hypothetical protein
MQAQSSIEKFKLTHSGFSTSLRLRYFGPRDLTSDRIFHSNATALLNEQVGYQTTKK